jgi:hypothetical protein
MDFEFVHKKVSTSMDLEFEKVSASMDLEFEKISAYIKR